MLTAILLKKKHDIFNTFAQYPSNAYVRQSDTSSLDCVLWEISLHSNIVIQISFYKIPEQNETRI